MFFPLKPTLIKCNVEIYNSYITNLFKQINTYNLNVNSLFKALEIYYYAATEEIKTKFKKSGLSFMINMTTISNDDQYRKSECKLYVNSKFKNFEKILNIDDIKINSIKFCEDWDIHIEHNSFIEDTWIHMFNINNTKLQPFYIYNNYNNDIIKLNIPTMTINTTTQLFSYYDETLECLLVSLPYYESESFFLIILPKDVLNEEKLTNLCNEINIRKFYEENGKLTNYDEISMPKFQSTLKFNLNQALYNIKSFTSIDGNFHDTNYSDNDSDSVDDGNDSDDDDDDDEEENVEIVVETNYFMYKHLKDLFLKRREKNFENLSSDLTKVRDISLSSISVINNCENGSILTLPKKMISLPNIKKFRRNKNKSLLINKSFAYMILDKHTRICNLGLFLGNNVDE